MATKKKAKKKSAGSKKSVSKKALKPAQKRKTPKKLAKQKSVSNKAAAKKKMPAKKSLGKPVSKNSRSKGRLPNSSAFSSESSGLQSGDLQGLSDVESVDSESVNELLEEGNAFEAGVVSGVEDSSKREGKEVRTREVPEDDVPGEYLDQD